MREGQLVQGKYVEQFEQQFAEYVGASHCVAVGSGTDALFLALKYKLEGFKYVHKVVVPALTFAATANVVRHCNRNIVFGDVNQFDYCLEGKYDDPVIKVHLNGAKSEAIGFPFTIEDSAHTVTRNQCKDNYNPVCFSFYATKNITCGEGGMIATNDEKLADWCRLARQHGKEDNEIKFPGWNMRMTDMQAVIGIVQLKWLEKMDRMRKKRRNYLNEKLGLNNQGIYLYQVLVNNRDKFLAEVGLDCRVHFVPLHKQPAYKQDMILRNTEYLCKHLVSLPFYPEMNYSEMDEVADKVLKTKLLI